MRNSRICRAARRVPDSDERGFTASNTGDTTVRASRWSTRTGVSTYSNARARSPIWSISSTGKDLGGNIGIAHTRWATHGVPNDANAHPHYSESENIALIHNGIIENYRVLKDALEQNGYTFRSSTDSEVLVNLIEYVRATSGCSLPEAVRQALRQVIGAYAIAVVEKGNHDRIVARAAEQPDGRGRGRRGVLPLSPTPRRSSNTREDFVYVGDGEIAVINRNAPLKIVTLDEPRREDRHQETPAVRSRSWKRAAIPISCSRRFTSSPGPSSTASADASTPTPAR